VSRSGWSVAMVLRSVARANASPVRLLTPRRVEPLPPQPGVVRVSPGLPAGVDKALTQQQLREPVPGPHQIPAAILPRTDQGPGVLLVESRDRDGRDLVQPQQLGQVDPRPWRRS
jgi:hypothetical protein